MVQTPLVLLVVHLATRSLSSRILPPPPPPPANSKRPQYPECEGNSICGFLQVNHKGLTSLEYCSCRGGATCPLEWDSFDGRSISQAESDQYKYCGPAPVLPECRSSDEVAYTSYQRYQGDQKVLMRDEIHCICPFGSTYQDVKFDFIEDDLDEIVHVSYFCLPLRECNATEHCKDITEKPGQYIVNPRCLCEPGLACPSAAGRFAAKTSRFAETKLHNIRCQAPNPESLTSADKFRLRSSKRRQYRQNRRGGASYFAN